MTCTKYSLKSTLIIIIILYLQKIKQEERDVEIIYPENSDGPDSGSPTPEKSNLESIESLDSGIDSASVNNIYYEMYTITTHL